MLTEAPKLHLKRDTDLLPIQGDIFPIRPTLSPENGRPIENFSEAFQYYYTNSDSLVQRKIDDFWQSFSEEGKYSLADRQNIQKALIISTVAHQFNLNEKKQTRKADGSPYIFHVLEMAQRLVADDLDWLCVAGALLHDVPEDVDLGDGLNTRNDWLEVIAREFADSQNGMLLSEIIDGVSEKEVPSDYLPVLRNSQIYKMISGYLEKGGLKGRFTQKRELTEEEYQALDSVVYNLEQITRAALKSPEHWRIFILKIADIWHNFQTIELVKPEKILRGRMAANLAEWLGWYEMRSDLVQMLSQATDMTNVYSPALGVSDRVPKPEDLEIQHLLDQSEEGLAKHFAERSLYLPSPVFRFAGWPIIRTDLKLQKWRKSTLPSPELILGFNREDLEDIYRKLLFTDGFLSTIFETVSAKNQQGYTYFHGTPVERIAEDNTATVVNIIGRRRFTYKVKVGTNQFFLLRFESNEPHIMDYFRRYSRVLLSKIPEAGLFHNQFREQVDLSDASVVNDQQLEAANFHLTSLMAFLYDISLPVLVGRSKIYLFIHQNRLFFLNGRRSFQFYYQLLGIPVVGSVKRYNRMAPAVIIRYGRSGKEELVPADISIAQLGFSDGGLVLSRRILVSTE